MKTVKKILLATVAALGISSSAHAAVVSLVGQVAASYTTAGALIANNPNVSTNPGTPAYYKINVLFNFSSATPTQDGFGNLAFNVTNLNNLGRAPTSNTGSLRPGYVPSNPNFYEDPTDTSTGGHPYFSTDSDTGTGAAATDLQAIVASIDPNSPAIAPTPNSFASDPRPNFGKVASQLIGSFFVFWNGTSQGTVTLDLLQHSYYTQNNAAGGGLNVVDPSGTDNDTTVTFGTGSVISPEPASLAFLTLGGLAAARRRRA